MITSPTSLRIPDSRAAQAVQLLREREAAEEDRAAEVAAAGEVAAPDLPLVEFIREGWHVVEPKRPYLHNWHIDAIAEHLTAVSLGEIRRLIINVQPRLMKSLSVCVFWPMWEWTFRPEIRWLFSSYSGSFSIRDSLKCRRLIQSRWYQQNWSTVFHLVGDQNQKSRFENNKTGYRLATSVGGVGTGEGGDRIVVDDPLKAGDAHSDTKREAANTWWDETMSTRGNDPESAAWVVICQRLHESDLPGHLLEEMDHSGDQYELLILPTEYVPTTYTTSIGWRDPRVEPGDLIWSQRFSRTYVEGLKRTLGARGAAAQLQQTPSPAEGDIFKRSWWRFWKPAGVELPPVRLELPDHTFIETAVVDLPAEFEEQSQSWDMTFKDTDDSAYVVGQVWARLMADRFLLDQVRDKMDIVKTLQAVRNLSAHWPRVIKKLVEDKANGPAVIQLLHREIPGLVAVTPEGGKVSRAYASTPFIEAGNVYLPHPYTAPWVYDFIEECARFPTGAYADQVDTMTQMLIYWIPKSEDEEVATVRPRVVKREGLF